MWAHSVEKYFKQYITPLNPPGVGVGHIFLEVRLYIRTCVQNVGAFGRERFVTIDNPLNPPGVGVGQFFLFFLR